MGLRSCADCYQPLPHIRYSNTQWLRGEGASRCMSCVHGYEGDRAYAEHPWEESARRNESSRAQFSNDALDNPFAEGMFRWVAYGRYTKGERAGQPCVCKWFKTGTVFEDEFFESDIKAVDRALQIVGKFNNLGIVDRVVRVNVPEVWTFDEDSSPQWAGSKTLTEPFIQNYEKFNSNTGWNDDSTEWHQVMQALSHFSYHISSGQYVLCDLQGGIYRHEVVLTDPVVLSRRREFGVTDLGPDGISSFFSQHECNDYCRPNWSAPNDQRQHYRPFAGTTMVRRGVPTAYSKPYNTHAYY